MINDHGLNWIIKKQVKTITIEQKQEQIVLERSARLNLILKFEKIEGVGWGDGREEKENEKKKEEIEVGEGEEILAGGRTNQR